MAAQKWTRYQKEYVEDIERHLKVVYRNPETKKDAHTFIELYKDDNAAYMDANNLQRPPTGKQRRYIKAIEQVLDIKFKGKTAKDASDFISEWHLEFKFEVKDCFTEDSDIEGEWNQFVENLV